MHRIVRISTTSSSILYNLATRLSSFTNPFLGLSLPQERKIMTKPVPLTLVQRYNPTKNKFEWTEEPDNYDYYQEIARSAYADMLHDHDRNIKYYEGLKVAIDLKRQAGEDIVVLDIGTGTGLLSMFAAKLGADRIYACEAFTPMAECASKVIERNGYTKNIKLIPKRSTELEVGPGKDLETRANILITEVFDTELIGEGAIEIFNHAHKCLLTDGCMVIPQKAIMYAQVVDCPLVYESNVLKPVNLPNGSSVIFPPSIVSCHGAPSVQDLQLSEIKRKQFKEISDPIAIFEFDWNTHTLQNPLYRSSLKGFQAKASASCNTIFMWWDLIMDPLGKHEISCRPEWSGPDSAWRDHWMQAAYYLPESYQAKVGENLSLQSFHDEFSLWYQIRPATDSSNNKKVAVGSNETVDNHNNGIKNDRPICDCGIHTTMSRPRIGMLNDHKRNEKFAQVLQEAIIPGETICLCLSEGSVLPLIAALLGAKKVFVIEEHAQSARVMQNFIAFNNLQNQVTVINKNPEAVTPTTFEDLKIQLVIGDPYFHSSVYPWNNLYYSYSKDALKWSFDENTRFIPEKAVLKGMAVNFDHLYKIKAPVEILKPFNFDLKDFDSLILPASDLADCPIDAQPLWEYRGIPCSETFKILSFDMTHNELKVTKFQEENKPFEASTNGVALWMDWQLSDSVFISTGPIVEPEPNVPIEWDLHSKQGVFFCRNNLGGSKDIDISFDTSLGDIKLSLKKAY